MIGLSGLGAGAAAIFVGGTILSPYTMQAYAAGGYSKSLSQNLLVPISERAINDI
ncbi:hypothetical protein FH587_03295 (plasmid) [Leptospira interrogans]|uniref:hypothetical protein n=1 Tax=Leptospira interrogans TaxID=173 RepID=UPI001F077F8A|nr:hypothetical protein [Leptospira interrogans]UML82992.1 hypothetical protein FH587_03295 [Leptospira interrogans]